jgi:predicted metal-dependent peptidase
MTQDVQKLISASLIRLRTKSPFFATLALFARFINAPHYQTAATDGKDIFYNPEFFLSLPAAQLDGVLLHEVLHAALLHVPRRGVRDATLWNFAADIVINGIIMQQGGFELPAGGLRDQKLEHLSVEEIYEILSKDAEKYQKLWESGGAGLADLLDAPGEGEGEGEGGGKWEGEGDKDDSMSSARKAALEAHWRNALQQAAVIARSSKQGTLPAGIERELSNVTKPQIDWRSYLWRYLVQTPNDFTGFDRRFVGRGLYLEALQGESVIVYVAIDTSGSIGGEELRLFLGEVSGILRSYPHLKCELYYVDADAYGPYELSPDSTFPKPQGGGGTSFVPFFDKVAERWDGHAQAVCVYLTDGYGYFPEEAPELPVLWVVTPGGMSLEQFPFGESVRLLSA